MNLPNKLTVLRILLSRCHRRHDGLADEAWAAIVGCVILPSRP